MGQIFDGVSGDALARLRDILANKDVREVLSRRRDIHRTALEDKDDPNARGAAKEIRWLATLPEQISRELESRKQQEST